MGILPKIKPKKNKPGELSPSAMKDQVVLITGGAGGIASAVAVRLARAGAKIVLADSSPIALREKAGVLLGAFPGSEAVITKDRLRTVVLDVTVPEGCADAADFAVREFGRLDVVWANAGIAPFEFMDMMDEDKWRDVININLIGAYNTVKGALPHIIKSKGYVAITSSWAAMAHSPGHSAYAASKAGVEAMANSLRGEVKEFGVKVGVFHPGWVGTRMVTDLQKEGSAYNLYLDSLPGPLGDVTTVDEIADVLSAALANRSTRVVHPKPGWFLYAMRSWLPTWPFNAAPLKAAPQMRKKF